MHKNILPFLTTSLLIAAYFFIPQLIFIAFVPFFVWLLGRPPKSFAIAFASGFIFYLIYLHWIWVIHHWSNYILAGLSWLLLAGYQALFWVLIALVVNQILKRTKNHFYQLLLVSIGAGLIFVIKGYLGPAALPIAPLTNFLVNQPYLIQGLSFWKLPGMELFILAVNIWLAQLIFYKKTTNYFKFIPLTFFLIYFIFSISIFYLPLNQKISANIRVGVMQPGVDQELKMDETNFEKQEQQLFETSLTFKREKVDYILWPETVIPRLLVQDQAFLNKTKKLPAPLLTGTPYYENNKLFNGLAYIHDGRVLQVVKKYHLVPFGEYLPFRKLLGFVASGSGLEWDYSPGDKNQLLYLSQGKVAPLICFESLFAQEVHSKIKAGGQAILLITNDAWFKKTDGMKQHAQYLVIRAIENRVFALSLGNTGPTYLVNPKGQITQKLMPFVEGNVVFTLPLRSR